MPRRRPTPPRPASSQPAAPDDASSQRKVDWSPRDILIPYVLLDADPLEPVIWLEEAISAVLGLLEAPADRAATA